MLCAQSVEQKQIAEVINKLKLDYVMPVADRDLLEGCRYGAEAYARTLSKPLLPMMQSPYLENLRDQIASLLSGIQQQHPEINQKHLAHACLQAMVARVDKEGAFIGGTESDQLQGTGVRLGGVGIEVGIADGVPLIMRSIENSPAEKAGVARGDVLVRIDEVPTQGLGLDEIARLLRGKLGSTVILTVLRKGAAGPLRVNITRDIVRLPSVRSRIVAPQYLYIRISSMQDATLALLVEAVTAAYRNYAGEPRGIVLDLRGNGGGLLNAAIGVASAFVPAGVLIAETKGRAKSSFSRFYASPEYYFRGGKSDPLSGLPPAVKKTPMIVMVDERTASGAEIVAAALQDHGRAHVLGVKTLGYGMTQTIFPMEGGSTLKLTTASFYRPAGAPIHLTGITPDVMLETSGRTPATSFGYAEDGELGQAVGILRGAPQ
jgi:carboxyl-terminal processing protease